MVVGECSATRKHLWQIARRRWSREAEGTAQKVLGDHFRDIKSGFRYKNRAIEKKRSYVDRIQKFLEESIGFKFHQDTGYIPDKYKAGILLLIIDEIINGLCLIFS